VISNQIVFYYQLVTTITLLQFQLDYYNHNRQLIYKIITTRKTTILL